MVYVVRGSGEHIHEHHSYPIHAGDCFIIDTGESHAYKKSKGLRIANILFPASFLKRQFPYLKTIDGFTALFSVEPLFRRETSFRYKLHLPGIQRLALDPLVDALVQEYAGRANGYAPMCSGLVLQIMTLTSRAFSAKESSQQHEDLSAKAEAVATAIQVLETRYQSDLSLADVAETVCLSGSRLSHLFKEKTGVALSDYLLRYRLEKARSLLEESSDSISRIALMVGFHDPAYFSRAFRNYFGTTPRQARIKPSA